LSTAQSNAVTWQGQAQQADTEGLAEARKMHPGTTDAYLRTTCEYSNHFNPIVNPLRSKYATEMTTLKNAATALSERLEGAIPGYKKG